MDGEKKQDGAIEDDWSILPPKEINDPSKSKPADWVDEAQMDDPADVKPADWDTIPAEIADPEAKKPEDWDDDLDGQWEAPKVPNPAYKGVWRAKRIANPAYKGPWVHPQIANPEYKADATLYEFDSNAFLGIEIWQVKAGTIFDNFLVTDDLDLALERAKALNKVREQEQALKKADDDKKAVLPPSLSLSLSSLRLSARIVYAAGSLCPSRRMLGHSGCGTPYGDRASHVARP